MNRLFCLLFIVLFVAAGCGSSSDSDIGDDTTLGFSSDIIGASTYYLTYEESGATVQSTIVFSGDWETLSTDTVVVTDEWYNESGVLQFKGIYDIEVTLNEDGSLTGSSSSYEGSDTLTETDDGVVEWTFADKTWIDDWSSEKPASWFETVEFTADMIDSDTYYVSYLSNEMANLKVQETLTFSSDATSDYSVTALREYYVADVSGTFEDDDYGDYVYQFEEEDTYAITLNSDGTLSATSDEGTVTFILLEETDTSFVVYGAANDNSSIGNDTWSFAQPADWEE
jgi:hypothetical protein